MKNYSMNILIAALIFSESLFFQISFVLSQSIENSQQLSFQRFLQQSQQRYLHEISLGSQDFCFALVIEASDVNTQLFGYKWNCKLPYTIPSLATIDLLNSNGEPLTQLSPAIHQQTIQQLKTQFTEMLEQLEYNFDTRPLVFLKGKGELRNENQDQINDILKEIRSVIKKQDGYILLDDSWVSLTSEQEESRFIWLAGNYAQGGFDISNSAKKSVILIEVNQNDENVVFNKSQIQIQPSISSPFDISDQENQLTANLISYSHFQYGTTSVLKKIVDLLGNSTEKAYCFRKIDAAENYYQYSSTKGVNITFKGDFNATACLNQITNIIDLNVLQKINSNNDVILVGSVIQSLAHYFLQNSKDANNDLDISQLDGEIDALKIRQIIIDNCNKPLQVTNNNKQYFFKEEYCLFGLYITALLIEGHNTTLNLLYLSGKINNLPISLGLGSLITDLKKIPQDMLISINNPQNEDSKDQTQFTSLMVVSVLTFAGLITLI